VRFVVLASKLPSSGILYPLGRTHAHALEDLGTSSSSDMTACSSVDRLKSFGGICCRHFLEIWLCVLWRTRPSNDWRI